MISNHIHDALGQVNTLRELIIEKRHFRGYSGRARILSGVTALLGAMAMSNARWVPSEPAFHFAGWMVVLFVGLVLNYACLFYWFLFDRQVRRDPTMLKPALDAIPALTVGAVLTAALVRTGEYNLLAGMWMCLYGLAQVCYRQSMPRGIYSVGLCYLAAGTYCLAWPSARFTNPWPMGIVFCLGETIGGIILIRNRHEA